MKTYLVIALIALSACGMSDKECQQQRLAMHAAAEQQRQTNIDEWHKQQLRVASAIDADTVHLSYVYLGLSQEQLAREQLMSERPWNQTFSSRERALKNYSELLGAIVNKGTSDFLAGHRRSVRLGNLDIEKSQQELAERNALVEPEYKKRFAALDCKCTWNEFVEN